MNRFIMPLCHCFLLVMVGLSPDLQAVNTWKGGGGGGLVCIRQLER